jgi:hypothetical protein
MSVTQSPAAVVDDGSGSGGPSGTPSHETGAQLAIATNQDGRQELYGIDPSGTVVHRAQLAQSNSLPTWTGSSWLAFDGQPMLSIAAATNLDGRVELVAIDQRMSIYRRVQPANNLWASSMWAQIAGQLTSVALVRGGDGRLEIFGTNVNDQIWHMAQSRPGNWIGATWQSIDGALTQVAAATNANGTITLFGVNAGGECFQRTQVSPGNWGPWSRLASQSSDVLATLGPMWTISAVTEAGGQINVFIGKGHGQVYQWRQAWPNSDFWNGPFPLDGVMTGVAACNGLTLELFGVNVDGAVFQRAQNMFMLGQWSQWAEFGGVLRGSTAPRSGAGGPSLPKLSRRS